MQVFLTLAALYRNAFLRHLAKSLPDKCDNSQPENLQDNGLFHFGTAHASAVNPEGDILHGSERKQFHDPLNLFGEKGQRDNCTGEKFHGGIEQDPQSLRRNGKKSQYINEHTKRYHDHQPQDQGDQKEHEMKRACRRSDSVRGWYEYRNKQNGEAS